MSIDLDENAIKIFKSMININEDNFLTPYEAANGINAHILFPLSITFPGIENGAILNEKILTEFVDESTNEIDEIHLKMLLEQYFEFLANKITNSKEVLEEFGRIFNKAYGDEQQNGYREMEIDSISNEELNPNTIDMTFDGHNEEDEEEQQAIALSLQNQRETPYMNEEDEEDEEERQAISLSLQNQDDQEERQAIALSLSLQNQRMATRNLDNLNNIIQVYDPLSTSEVSAIDFLNDNEDSDYSPFIIRGSNGKFSGDAINWPSSSSSGKEFIECKDTTPSSWQGNSYKQWIKTNARHFIKMFIFGSPTLVIKPTWYDRGIVPGTKYFNLIPGGKVFKFMSLVLASQNLPEDFTALGSDHCNQTGELGVYRLEEITLDELNTMIPRGGNPYNRIKNKKSRKTKKLNKKQKTKKPNKKLRKTKNYKKSKKSKKRFHK